MIVSLSLYLSIAKFEEKHVKIKIIQHFRKGPNNTTVFQMFLLVMTALNLQLLVGKGNRIIADLRYG